MPIASGVWKVLESKSSKFSKGDYVNHAASGWADYAMSDESDVQSLPQHLGLPLSTFVGILGFPGLTAYFGRLSVLRLTRVSTEERLEGCFGV